MSETIQRDPVDNAPVPQPDTPQRTSDAPPIGLIAQGPDAADIATRLLAAGHRLLALQATPPLPDPTDIADTPAEIARRCQIILVLLPLGEDDPLIEQAIAPHAAPGTLIIDLTPSLPARTRALAATLATQGLRLTDAAPIPTRNAILLGGAEADASLALPILTALGTCISTGPVGTAQALSALLAELDQMPDIEGIHARVDR